MTINSLLTALDEVKLLLSEANILKYENTSRARSIVNTKLSAEFLSIMYSDDYDNIYKTAMKNNDFDFVLFDDSFIQFSAIKGEIKPPRLEPPPAQPIIISAFSPYLSSAVFVSRPITD